MAWRKINDSILSDIANAVREKAGTEDSLRPQEIADAIRGISGGGGGELQDVAICGMLEQSGTPTIEIPIPIGCVKEGTKVRFSSPMTTATAWINATNQLSYSSDSYAVRLDVKPNTRYELYLDTATATLFRAGVTSSEVFPVSGTPIALSPCVRVNNPDHITLNTGASGKYIWVQIAASQKQAIYRLTVIDKSNNKTYKPFTMPDVTAPFDLYEGDEWYPFGDKSIRRKNKIVLTGTEDWNDSSVTNAFSIFVTTNPRKKYADGGSIWSNIAVGGLTAMPASAQRVGKVFTSDASSYLAFGYKGRYTLTEWKAYLAEQYANGTPVYVVYDLETPIETTNAPLTMSMSLMGTPTTPPDEGETEGEPE